MSYALREHTSEVAVEATAESLDAVFAAAADGLAAAQCVDPPDRGDRFDVAVAAEHRDALLLDYLNHLLYRRDVDGVLPVANRATVVGPDASGYETDSGATAEEPGSVSEIGDTAPEPDANDAWALTGTFRGVPLAAVEATEVKAATYGEFDLSRTDDGWRAYVVLDV